MLRLVADEAVELTYLVEREQSVGRRDDLHQIIYNLTENAIVNTTAPAPCA